MAKLYHTTFRARAQAAKTLRQYGMGVSLKSSWASQGMLWDGKTLHAGGNGQSSSGQSRAPLDAALMYHELGHYLVAHEKWRPQSEYGLGSPPFADHWCSVPRIRDDLGREENPAYLLGLAFAAAAGLDVRWITLLHPVLRDSDHLLIIPRKFWPHIKRLNERGLLVGAMPRHV